MTGQLRALDAWIDARVRVAGDASMSPKRRMVAGVVNVGAVVVVGLGLALLIRDVVFSWIDGVVSLGCLALGVGVLIDRAAALKIAFRAIIAILVLGVLAWVGFLIALAATG